jgi:hypothetical protein
MTRRMAAIIVAGAAVLSLAPAAPAKTPKVSVQVVGRTGLIGGARDVVPKAFTLKVQSRRCAVPDATPLAALEQIRRSSDLPYTVRDFGSCSKRSSDAGQLFVRSVGTEANKGRDGWVYKVGRKVGTTGAADMTGPFGTGKRLRAGDRLLWFWCVQGSRGCQRTLEITPAATTVAPNARVGFTVRGYDDQGKGKAVKGATVTLGGQNVTTDAKGRATVVAPPLRGPVLAFATATRMADAFPAKVTVR